MLELGIKLLFGVGIIIASILSDITMESRVVMILATIFAELACVWEYYRAKNRQKQ